MHISHLLDTPANRAKAVRQRLRDIDRRMSARTAAAATCCTAVWTAGAIVFLLRWVP